MRTRGGEAAFIAVGFVLFCAVSSVRGEPENIPSVRLNPIALAYAKQLITGERVVIDRKGAWANDRPSTELDNEFIRVHGFSEYAKWHLGIDDRYRENTKQRYKFPYGDFKNVHRCGLLAAKARARQYGYTEIENAAAKLERAIGMQPKSNGRLRWPIRGSSTAVVEAVAAASAGLIRS